MSSSDTQAPIPEGPGAVSGAPNLPEGFADTFASRFVEAGDVRLHAVVGGEGMPLLLIHGWPQTWYEWRLVMPLLANQFCLVAPDLRGLGDSSRPIGGYDKKTVAQALKEAEGKAGGPIKVTGFVRFAVGEGVDKPADGA